MSEGHDTNSTVTRRRFLATSGVLAAGAMVPVEALSEATAQVPKVVLGKTGEKVSKLAFGGAVNITPQLMNAALSQGVTFIDTAQGYGRGNSERELGKYFAKSGRRDECFVVTKSGDFSPEGFVRTLEEESLPRLQTDFVDLYYLHNLGDPNRLDDEMKATAERLKKEKKIRFFGFSSHHAGMVETMNRAAEVGFVDVIMLVYNFRTHDDDELKRAIDRCAAAGIGLVSMKTQAGNVSWEMYTDRNAPADSTLSQLTPFTDKGFSRHQAALKFAWANEAIHSSVSHMVNIKMLRENAQAAIRPSMGLLEGEQLQQYADATQGQYCRGCGDICEACTGTQVAIADTLRYRMYSEHYGEREKARRLYAELPGPARDLSGADLRAAEAACPHGVPVEQMMRQAAAALS